MNDNIKTSLGLFFPFSSIALFVYFSIMGSFLAAILAVVGGAMFWYLYSLVVESQMPDITGNLIVLFGGLLAIGFFLNYGISKNMFGGFNVNIEGTAVSAVVLFFSVLLGLNLRARPLSSVEPGTLKNPVSSPTDSVASDPAEDGINKESPSESFDENYPHYGPSDYEYPDYYDYEYDDEDYGFYEAEE